MKKYLVFLVVASLPIGLAWLGGYEFNARDNSAVWLGTATIVSTAMGIMGFLSFPDTETSQPYRQISILPVHPDICRASFFVFCAEKSLHKGSNSIVRDEMTDAITSAEFFIVKAKEAITAYDKRV